MSRDLQCLYSISTNIPKPLQNPPRQSSSRLNHVFIRVAQEAAGQVQQSHPAANPNSTPAETITIRAIEPEHKLTITVEPLTERELEVLQLIVDGHSNSAIGKKLYISLGTVKSHVRSILKKLCANDRTQAAIRALRAGLAY